MNLKCFIVLAIIVGLFVSGFIVFHALRDVILSAQQVQPSYQSIGE
jgi:hypothetical protein